MRFLKCTIIWLSVLACQVRSRSRSYQNAAKKVKVIDNVTTSVEISTVKCWVASMSGHGVISSIHPIKGLGLCQSLAEFNNYINSPIVNYQQFTIRLQYEHFLCFVGQRHLKKSRTRLLSRRHTCKMLSLKLEEQAIKLTGTDVYEKLIKCYTES